MKTAKYIQIAILFLLPMILLLGSIFSPDRESSQRENRNLTQLPKLTAASLFSGDYMTRFEKYMSDQVVGRDGFVAAKTFLNRATGKTEQNGVYIGEDGWLFEEPSKYDDEKVSETVNAIRSFCEECEIENQMFVLAPNSSEIVTEKLPKHLSFESQENQIQKIYSRLPEKINCIDAERALKNGGNPEKLYYKSDHHWTSYGAKSVFDTVAKSWELDVDSVNYQTYALSDSFFGTLSSSSGIYDNSDVIEAIIPENSAGTYIVLNSSQKTKSVSMFDLSKLENGNQYEVFLGGNFSKLTITTTSNTENKLLLFKDSYANCMLPMLTPFFKEIVVVDARYFTDDIRAVVNDGEFTHMMFLYNVNTFLEDTSLKSVLE